MHRLEWLFVHIWKMATQVCGCVAGYMARLRRARRGSAGQTKEGGDSPFDFTPGQYSAPPDENVLAENITLPETGTPYLSVVS